MSRRFYFCRDGVTVEGPVEETILRLMVFRRELSLITPICAENTDAWIPFNEVPALEGPVRSLFLFWLLIIMGTPAAIYWLWKLYALF